VSEQHVSSAALLLFATADPSQSPAERASIAEHCRACVMCAADVAALRFMAPMAEHLSRSAIVLYPDVPSVHNVRLRLAAMADVNLTRCLLALHSADGTIAVRLYSGGDSTNIYATGEGLTEEATLHVKLSSGTELVGTIRNGDVSLIGTQRDALDQILSAWIDE
jgi:anti-sigma factor RsiW